MEKDVKLICVYQKSGVYLFYSKIYVWVDSYLLPHGDWQRVTLGSGSALACWNMTANYLLVFILKTNKIILSVKFSKENLENTSHGHK